MLFSFRKLSLLTIKGDSLFHVKDTLILMLVRHFATLNGKIQQDSIFRMPGAMKTKGDHFGQRDATKGFVG
jgi:hypothetical protein